MELLLGILRHIFGGVPRNRIQVQNGRFFFFSRGSPVTTHDPLPKRFLFFTCSPTGHWLVFFFQPGGLGVLAVPLPPGGRNGHMIFDATCAEGFS